MVIYTYNRKGGYIVKKILIAMALSLFILAGCSNSEKVAEYRSDLQTVTDEMLNNASAAEELLNQYATVWSYSIESRGGITVEDMAKETGLSDRIVFEHFTDSDYEVVHLGERITGGWQGNIQSLKNYYSASGKLDEIEELSSEIKSSIKDLNNPPEGYEKAYDEVLELYTLAGEYTQMAINPSGSLVTFNQDRGQLSTDIVSKVKEIEVIMPNEE